MNRSVTALAGLLLIACSDDVITPPPVPPYEIEVVALGSYRLVDLNDAGQALFKGADDVVLWESDAGARTLPLVSAVDLGPDGGVLGSSSEGVASYWKDGSITELGQSSHMLGIANSNGKAYYERGGEIHTWDGTVEETVPAPDSALVVGEDGTFYGLRLLPPDPSDYAPRVAYQCWAWIDGERVVALQDYHRCWISSGNIRGWFLFGDQFGAILVSDGAETWRIKDAGYCGNCGDLNDMGTAAVTPFILWSEGDTTRLDSFMAVEGWTENTEARINNRGQLLLDVANEAGQPAVLLLTPRQ